MIEGGAEALQALLDDGTSRPRKSDLGPRLEWESPVWIWFMRLAREHPRRVQPGDWWKAIEHEGWHAGLAWRLLMILEGRFAAAAESEAQQEAARHARTR